MTQNREESCSSRMGHLARKSPENVLFDSICDKGDLAEWVSADTICSGGRKQHLVHRLGHWMLQGHNWYHIE